MEHEISMEQRLNRIEQLLAGQKNVLTFDEACTYTGISRTYMYKLTCGSRIPHYKPNGKNIYSTGRSWSADCSKTESSLPQRSSRTQPIT